MMKCPIEFGIKRSFFSDWMSQIKNNELFEQKDIDLALEVVIKDIYQSYVDLISMAEKELPDYLMSRVRKKLNLAMTNILEFGQRRTVDIIASLESRKWYKSEEGAEVFNSIIDHLILQLEQAQKNFSDLLDSKK